MTMRERRKHKSLWNMEEEETNHLSGMRKHDIEHLSSNGNNKRHQEFPASRNSPGFASTDHWHSIADKNQSVSINESYMRSRHEIFEGKEIIEGKRYYKDMSPEKTNEETRKYDEARDYNRDHRHAQRYPVRGRSRSRSRSRSKSRGNTRDRLRDDSPTRDQRRLSHAWSDRRSSHEKSPQACRNFSLGKCNRGSQCRFSHSDNRINRRDGDNIQDDDDAGTWRDRADHSRLIRLPYDRSSGLASRADDVLSESYRSRSSRSDVPCKDFVRGNCRWGDSCRFSHHVESDEFSRGSKKGNFDKGNERQSWRPFHKSFSSPMSDRENNREGVLNDDKCSTRDLRKRWDGPTWDDVDKPSEPVRISGWGEPTLTNLNVTVESNIGERDDKWGHTDEDKPCEKRWDGPTWDDVDKPSEPVRINGWGEPTLTNLNVTVESNIGEKDDKWGHTLRNETRSWEIPENADSISNVGKQPHRRSNKTISADDLANKEQLLLDMSQLQNRNGAINVYESNALQVCQSISEVPHQSRRLVINLAKSHVSEVHEEAKGPTIPTVLKVDLSEHYPDLSRGDISSEPCSISNGAYTEQNLLSFDKSNGVSTHQHSVPSDLRSQKVDQLSGILEPKPPHISTDSLPVESDTARVTNSADQVENSSSIEKIHSFTDTSGSMALLKTETSQLHSIPPSLDLSSCSKNVTGNTEQSGFRTRPDLEHSSLRPLVCDTSVMNLQENPNLRQESKVVVANSEVAEENRVIDKETEDIEGNKGTKTVEGQGKTEEGCITEKDDKGTRMFKNALIEFVKDILKPAWKEGRMSREVHKTVVKKVVDKVSTSIQAKHVPRTQDKVEHYLSFSKSKITKLVQAYVERCHKAETTGVTK